MTIVYRKTIGNRYVYVEEIRIGRNKNLDDVLLCDGACITELECNGHEID